MEQVNVNFNNLRQPKSKRKWAHLVYRGQIETTKTRFFRSINNMPLLESYIATDAQLLQSHPLNSAYNHPLPALITTTTKISLLAE
jgi:hypothetical protein